MCSKKKLLKTTRTTRCMPWYNSEMAQWPYFLNLVLFSYSYAQQFCMEQKTGFYNNYIFTKTTREAKPFVRPVSRGHIKGVFGRKKFSKKFTDFS